MSDKYDEYFESQEANDDSKSDARVALVLIAAFVAGMIFWISGQ